MKSFKEIMLEEYKPTVTIVKNDKSMDEQTFSTEKEALIFKKEMIKKYKLTKQRGFYGNSKSGIELSTNF